PLQVSSHIALAPIPPILPCTALFRSCAVESIGYGQAFVATAKVKAAAISYASQYRCIGVAAAVCNRAMCRRCARAVDGTGMKVSEAPAAVGVVQPCVTTREGGRYIAVAAIIPIQTRSATLFPYTTLFRSYGQAFVATAKVKAAAISYASQYRCIGVAAAVCSRAMCRRCA